MEGRDVKVEVKGDYLSFEVSYSPLDEDASHLLVFSNCDDALVKDLKSPEAETFLFPLPKEVIPRGKHVLIEDSSNRYFGINLQKSTEFNKQSLVQSFRTKHLEKQQEKIAENKREIANQYLDKLAKREAALAILKEFEEEEAHRNLNRQVD